MPSFAEREKAKMRADAMRHTYYEEGKTYEAIAKEYGISKQRVHQIVTGINTKCGRKEVPFIKSIQKIVFPEVVNYCIENRLSISQFITLCGITGKNEQAPMRSFLIGKTKPKLKYTKLVSDVTGISIEKLMGVEF